VKMRRISRTSGKTRPSGGGRSSDLRIASVFFRLMSWRRLVLRRGRLVRLRIVLIVTFRVGAAVLTGDGVIVGGCNVENVSYGLSICAERVAIFQAVTKGHPQIQGAGSLYSDREAGDAVWGLSAGDCEFGIDAAIVCICDGEGIDQYYFEGIVGDAIRAGVSRGDPCTQWSIAK